MTALHEAAATGDAQACEYILLSDESDPDGEDWDWGKRTPLHVAAAGGHVACVEKLLEHGADGEMRMAGGWTPAHCAAEKGNVEILQVLVDNGASVMKKDNTGDTPKRVAQIYGNVECVKFIERLENLKSHESDTADHSRSTNNKAMTRGEIGVSPKHQEGNLDMSPINYSEEDKQHKHNSRVTFLLT